jgi:hypothetical protein
MSNFAEQNSQVGSNDAAAQSAPNASNYEQAYLAQEAGQLQRQLHSGANWFYWIAGLSLINSLAALVGSNWRFIAGLGITQVIDAIARELAGNGGGAAKIIAFVFDLLGASIFVVFGIFAGKKMTWAFAVGMFIYGLDALIFLLGMDILAIAFHAYAMYCLFRGLRACQQLNQMEKPY